jgi:hypothetical protein
MKNEHFPKNSDDTLELAQKCLLLISNIAARGARAQNPEHIGYALQELSQVLYERTGNEHRIFEPVPAHELQNLDETISELEFVEGCAEEMIGRTPNPFQFLPGQLQ